MRTHLQFKSDAFPPYPNEDEETNPGIFGKRLAEFLALKLAADEFPTAAFELAEDWGWLLKVDRHVWIGCSTFDENDLLVQIQPSKGYVRKLLFERIDVTETLERVATAVERDLLAIGATDLRWWSDKESGR